MLQIDISAHMITLNDIEFSFRSKFFRFAPFFLKHIPRIESIIRLHFICRMFSLKSGKNKKSILIPQQQPIVFLLSVSNKTKFETFFPFIGKKQKASIACLDVRKKNLIEKKMWSNFWDIWFIFDYKFQQAKAIEFCTDEGKVSTKIISFILFFGQSCFYCFCLIGLRVS